MQKRTSLTLRAERKTRSMSRLRSGAFGHQSSVKKSMPNSLAHPMCCSTTAREAEEYSPSRGFCAGLSLARR